MNTNRGTPTSGFQTVEECLEEAFNFGIPYAATAASLESYIHMLLDTYPTPRAMRSMATKISKVRQDELASQVIELMRGLADDMQSGQLRRWGVNSYGLLDAD